MNIGLSALVPFYGTSTFTTMLAPLLPPTTFVTSMDQIITIDPHSIPMRAVRPHHYKGRKKGNRVLLVWSLLIILIIFIAIGIVTFSIFLTSLSSHSEFIRLLSYSSFSSHQIGAYYSMLSNRMRDLCWLSLSILPSM